MSDHVVVRINGYKATYKNIEFDLRDPKGYSALLTWLHQDNLDTVRSHIKHYMMSYMYSGINWHPVFMDVYPNDLIYVDFAQQEEKLAADIADEFKQRVALNKDDYIHQLQDRALKAEKDAGIIGAQRDGLLKTNDRLQKELEEAKASERRAWRYHYSDRKRYAKRVP